MNNSVWSSYTCAVNKTLLKLLLLKNNNEKKKKEKNWNNH